MNLSIVRRTLALRYDGAAMWPLSAVGAEYMIVDASLPTDLVYRRIWCCMFADPVSTGMPSWRNRVLLTEASGAEVVLFDWKTNYKDPITPPQEVIDGFTGICPPFSVAVGTGSPDRASSVHAGAADARVMSFRNDETVVRQLRATMWPVNITARLNRVRFVIDQFAIDGGASGDLTGNLYAGFVLQSQSLP